MSKKGHAYRKERERRKKEARKADEARRQTAPKHDAQRVLKDLHSLFDSQAARAVHLVTTDGMAREEVAARLNVPVERVTKLLDLLGRLPDGIREKLVSNPEVLLNRSILDAAQSHIHSFFDR